MKNEKYKQLQKNYHFSAVTFPLIFFLFNRLIKIKVYGENFIPNSGGLVIASNHRSVLDPFLIAYASSGTRTIRWISASLALKIPFIGGFFSRRDCLFVDIKKNQKNLFIKTVIDQLQKGECIGFFPEGADRLINSHLPLKPAEFKRGFAYVAASANVPILPVCIIPESEKLMSYPVPDCVYKWIMKRIAMTGSRHWLLYCKVQILFLPPIYPDQHKNVKLETDELCFKVENLIRQAIEKHIQQE